MSPASASSEPDKPFYDRQPDPIMLREAEGVQYAMMAEIAQKERAEGMTMAVASAQVRQQMEVLESTFGTVFADARPAGTTKNQGELRGESKACIT